MNNLEVRLSGWGTPGINQSINQTIDRSFDHTNAPKYYCQFVY
jgi:hypothetical protein